MGFRFFEEREARLKRTKDEMDPDGQAHRFGNGV